MKIDYLYGVMALIVIAPLNINAAELYKNEGRVTSESSEYSESGFELVAIDGKEYKMDNEVIVHNDAIKWPYFLKGRRVGFNIVDAENEVPSLAEVWVLKQ